MPEIKYFCPPGDDMLDIWQGDGLSRCFMDMFPIAVVFIMSICLLVMIIRIGARMKRGKKCTKKPCQYNPIGIVEDPPVVAEMSGKCKRRHLKGFAFATMPRPFLYILQCFVHLLLAVYPIVDVVSRIIVCDTCITGSVILRDALFFLSWTISFYCLQKERKFRYHARRRSHSLLLLAFVTLSTVVEMTSFVSWYGKHWWFVNVVSTAEHLELYLFCVRLTCCVVSFALVLKAPGLKQGLEDEQSKKKTASEGSTFANFWGKTKKLYPFLWPKERLLQLRVMVCFVLLICGRVLNVYTPLQYKRIVNYLTGENVTSSGTPWNIVAVYVALMFFKGGGGGQSGLLNNLRSFLWIRIQQYTSRTIQVQLFDHLHSLSLRWHLGRKTGEVLRMIDRGATSIDNLLNYFLFSILPTIVDIIIAIVFFATAFNGYFALIVFCAMVSFIVVSIVITEWRTKFRRSMNRLDNAVKAKAVDSLLNFETVKYYNNEDFEVSRYNIAILGYQLSEWKAQASLSLLNICQALITNVGLLVGTLYCAHLVVNGTFKVGDFVLFITYMIQLYAPLNFFGTYYRLIQSAFIDMENMFDLMEEDVEVLDSPDAPALQLDTGSIEFRNVSFHYHTSRNILRDISFTVRPGQTVALVGPSGGGKSTIIRLLFRFYECSAGSVLIDGQDISMITQKSLRACIGVVPQDTVLFNDTIRYNINYGNVYATDKECEDAARAADMHNKIMTFTDAYDTPVGERGLKLSGGEKQRVAIARTILKAPSIVVLDEATSALDTQTERNIQASLEAIATGKTSVVIAHRLSTIVGADQILVLKDGSIVERGRHDELLSLDGVYANMWNQQQQTNSPNETESSGSSEALD